MSLRHNLKTGIAAATFGLIVGGVFAQKVQMNEVRRPSTDFLQYGDVVGLSEGVLGRLGIEEGDPVQVTTPDGETAAFATKIYGDKDAALFAKKSLREALGVVDGPNAITLEPVRWGKGPAEATTLDFGNVVKPPLDFLDYGDAVGIGFDAMKSVDGFPGMEATVSGPGGSADVTVELLDRGNGTIAMKQTLRRQIGVTDGEASVKLEVKAASASASDSGSAPLYWYNTVTGAISAAREEYRPVLVYADDGGAASKALDQVMADSTVQQALLKTRKYRFSPSEDANSAAFFKTTNLPTVVLLSPEGQELARLEGTITKPQLISQIGEAVSQVKRPDGASDND